MSRVLVISNDYVSRRMAGPAIRCFELSKALSRNHDVTLACENEPDIQPDGFAFNPFKRNAEALLKAAEASDVIVVPPFTLSIYPQLKTIGKPIVMDMYDPFVLEKLEVYAKQDGWVEFESDLRVLKDQLTAGDFFIAGTEDQRSFWLGMLTALGRINPATYGSDKSLQNLVCVIPFGLSDNPPIQTKNVLKGVVEGIASDDFVLIWAGGIWNWFDPFTLIRAMKRVSEVDGSVRLFFLGVGHPHPAMPKEQFRVANEAKSLAEELQLAGKMVFFNQEWVPYQMRQNFLLEADAGVSTHFDHVENRFSIRTRALDYIWAGLPMIMTEGDYISRLVRQRGLGITVPERDPDALFEAIMELRGADESRIGAYKQGLRELGKELCWSRIVKPLDEFCQSPGLAADKALLRPPDVKSAAEPQTRRPSAAKQLVDRLKKLLLD